MLGGSYVCADGSYNPMGTMLLQSGEETIRTIFLRGANHVLGAKELVTTIILWFVLAGLSAGITAPLGLMVPLSTPSPALDPATAAPHAPRPPAPPSHARLSPQATMRQR